MIELRLQKTFPGFSLDIECTAGPGVTVLFGPSGSGKTLTLDCIAGFVRPDSGRILLDNQILFDGEARVDVPPRLRRTGYVLQNYALFPHMTLRQNLEFAAASGSRPERRRRVNEMLDRFHLAELAGNRPAQLSGGQKQRCSIARSLLTAPRLLLLDEPARGLDTALRADLYEILHGIDTPVMLVTHDLEEAFALGQRMIVLREGRVLQTGAPRDISAHPASLEIARLLGGFNVLPLEVRALDPGRNTSRLRYLEYEIAGTYLPGKLIGDRVWLCIRPDELTAHPKNGRPSANQIPASLVRAVATPRGSRLEFSPELAVDSPEKDVPREQDWVITFPAGNLRIL